jgi:hypothetical protein
MFAIDPSSNIFGGLLLTELLGSRRRTPGCQVNSMLIVQPQEACLPLWGPWQVGFVISWKALNLLPTSALYLQTVRQWFPPASTSLMGTSQPLMGPCPVAMFAPGPSSLDPTPLLTTKWHVVYPATQAWCQLSQMPASLALAIPLRQWLL